MRFVDHNDFTLIAWLSDSDEDPLQESKSELSDVSVAYLAGREQLEPGVDCWVPSVEGSRFYVKWGIQLPKKKSGDKRAARKHKKFLRDNLEDLRCRIILDGKPTSAVGILTKQDLIDGYYGTMTGEDVDPDDEDHEGEDEEPKERPFQFGKLTLKEDDVGAIQPGDLERNFLNMIQVVLEWGTARRTPEPVHTAAPWESTGSVRKADLSSDYQNLNTSMAGLGNIVTCESSGESGSFEFFEFHASSKPGTWFNFFHAPRWWLKAERIPLRCPRVLGSRQKKNKTRRANQQRGVVISSVQRSDSDPEVKPNIGQPQDGPERNVDMLEINNEAPRAGFQLTLLDGLKANSGTPSNRHGPQIDLTSDSDDELATPDDSPIVPSLDATRFRPLKRAPSQEIIDVDALSDSEIGTQMDHKANLFESKAPTPSNTRTRFFVGKITRRRPRRGAGPNKQAKTEEDELLKIEETSTGVAPEGNRQSVPLEGNAEADVKPNAVASCNSEDDIVITDHYATRTSIYVSNKSGRGSSHDGGLDKRFRLKNRSGLDVEPKEESLG